MRRNALRALGLGSALAVLTALLCLGVAASFESPTLSLTQLQQTSHSESVLMSCADDSGPGTGDTMLWCSDPSSPHCIPAAPEVPRPDIWDRPDSWLLASFDVPSATFVLLPWPRPETSTRHAQGSASRLERPPRS